MMNKYYGYGEVQYKGGTVFYKGPIAFDKKISPLDPNQIILHMLGSLRGLQAMGLIVKQRMKLSLLLSSSSNDQSLATKSTMPN